MSVSHSQPYVPALGFFGNLFLEHTESGSTTNAIAEVSTHTFATSYFDTTDIILIYYEVTADTGGGGADGHLYIDGQDVGFNDNQAARIGECRVTNSQTTANKLNSACRELNTNMAATTDLHTAIGTHGITGALTIALGAGKNTCTTAYWKLSIFRIKSV